MGEPKNQLIIPKKMDENVEEMVTANSKESNDNSINIKCKRQIDSYKNNKNEILIIDSDQNKQTIFAYTPNSRNIIEDFKNNGLKIETNEKSEENFLEKKRFEEIEDKLEEMFAGIEDEHLLTTTSDKTIFKNHNKVYSTDKPTLLLDNYLKYNSFPLVNSPHPTKAAKKSSIFGGSKKTNELKSDLEDKKNSTILKSMLYLKAINPHRRLSIGMNRKSLKFSVKVNDELKEQSSTHKFQRENISHLSESQKYKQKRKIRDNIPKTKIKNNERLSEYEMEDTYIKSNIRIKKNVFKPKSNKTKQNQQDKKRKLVQHLLPSENYIESEERPLQVRDIETKHRSPFVLIKKNGSITVVNTVTLDDSNEKLTKSKKPNNYVCERKTVKGCHSSTLSNRYDADTADSTWICVFCKVGPHKKELGDLFGPYIISSDCDEFRYLKNFTAILQKSDVTHFFKLSNKSEMNTKEKLLTECSDCNDEHWINRFFLGMSQISDDCFEIWVHDECAIWAPNIFVIGSRLTGLEGVIWDSMRNECIHCLKNGALLCCLQRGCNATSHVPCARDYNWLLDERKFWVYCNKHICNK